MTSLAPAKLLSVEVALRLLVPFFRPLTTPRVRPLASVANDEVRSVPSRSTFSVLTDAEPGNLISTRAEPPLIRSARFDSVCIVTGVDATGVPLRPPHDASPRQNARAAAVAANFR